MTPTDLAEAIKRMVDDPRFYAYLEGGLPEVEHAVLLDNSVVVHMDSGHTFLVQVSRAPDKAYL
jgi:hypothetical protein